MEFSRYIQFKTSVHGTALLEQKNHILHFKICSCVLVKNCLPQGVKDTYFKNLKDLFDAIQTERLPCLAKNPLLLLLSLFGVVKNFFSVVSLKQIKMIVNLSMRSQFLLDAIGSIIACICFWFILLFYYSKNFYVILIISINISLCNSIYTDR